MKVFKIPQDTIFRLSHYLRALNYFKNKKEIVSSKEIADFLNISPHQLRKDLSYFGQFGKKGVGYNCSKLIDKIKEILGLDRVWNACIIGFGNLGKALSFYRGFRDQGIFIKFAFDIDKNKINKKYKGLEVYHIDKIEEIIKKNDIKIAIITVPEDEAQKVLDILYNSGIKAILNFAPKRLLAKDDIILKDVDLSLYFSYLTYSIKG